MARGLDLLGGAIDGALERSRTDAQRALDAPAGRLAAFNVLGEGDYRGDERGVVLARGDSTIAWGGTIRVPIDHPRPGLGVVATSFYLAVTTTAERDGRRATAVALIDAAPPADRLAAPLARRVAQDAGLSGFIFEAPSD